MDQRLARTVNLGDAMEAPQEGDWGVLLKEGYFQKIAQAGFTAVRIPIRFSAHAGTQPPYMVDPVFLSRVDWAVENAGANGLVAIVDMHHYLEMYDQPLLHRTRFITLWQQIAEHYKDYPDEMVYFELLNEPTEALTDSIWNSILAETVHLIRQSNPTRPIIVGPTSWNAFDHLIYLDLPDDPYLIVTFHYYLPFEFTHQGADWVEGSDAWLGSTWDGTAEELASISRDFNTVAAWAQSIDRPVFLGEFGAYEKTDSDSRIRWTEAVRRAAEARGFSWGYWEFCSGFGIYDPSTDQWRQSLLTALIPTP